MKTIQEMLQELSQCIVTVSGEFRFRTNWSGGKVPQPDLDTFDPNVPFCIENVGDVPVEIGLYDYVYSDMPFILHVRRNCKISYNLKTWQDYDIVSTKNLTTIPDVNKITLKNNGDRVYIKADFRVPSRTTDFFTRLIVLNQSKDTKIRARGNIISLNKGSDDVYKTDYLKFIYPEDNCCFWYLFKDCTSLTQAPELPATALAIYCYSNMFKGCTSLTQAPELPATKSAEYCYHQMFSNCTSLTQAPELPATTLNSSCYESMFSGCTSLTKAPELPATKLNYYCYYKMFEGCTKLNYVKCLATDGFTLTDCTTNWLNNVSSTGTFECDNKKYFTIDSPNGIPVGWSITEINPDPPTPPEPEKPDLDTFDPNVPFCIENVGDVPVEIGMYDVTSNIRNTCEISYNNKDWITYNLAVDPNPSDIKKIKLQNKGDRVYIKSNHFGTTMSPTPYTRIKVLNESDTTKIQARGNIASLNYALYDEYKTKYNSTKDSCYLGLFTSCKSLVKAPDLVATSLSKSCYMTMFKGCTNLKYIKCDATDISASNCTFEWVWGVASKGDFYTPASTNWTSGVSGIPSGWTRHDIT